MKALPILFDVYEPEKITKKQALVGAGDQTEQRLRFGTESFQIEEPTKNRALAKTLGGTQQTTQGQTVSIGDVDVEFLHQPRRQKSSEEPQANPGTRQRPIARPVWDKLTATVSAALLADVVFSRAVLA